MMALAAMDLIAPSLSLTLKKNEKKIKPILPSTSNIILFFDARLSKVDNLVGSRLELPLESPNILLTRWEFRLLKITFSFLDRRSNFHFS